MRVTVGLAGWRLATATVGALAMGLLAAGTARAGIDDASTPDYETSVLDIQLSGTAVPGPGSPRPAAPPPICWWEQAGPDAEDPTAFAESYHAQARSYGSADMVERQYLQVRGGSAALDRAIADETSLGQPGVTWYTLKWDSDRMAGDDFSASLVEAGCTDVVPWRGDSQVAVIYAYFEHGEEPAPRVDVSQLARYAYDAMDLVRPALEWNPQARDHGNAAVVNLPTWVWAANSASVEDQWIQANVGPVWARVEASPTEVTVRAEGQTVRCTPRQARLPYAAGRDEDSACILTFRRASHATADGFGVEATVTWQARWTSSTGEGGTFDDGRSVSWTTVVPVVSVQSLVTQVD